MGCDFIKLMELFTILFGLFCVLLSIHLAYKFRRFRHQKIAQALGWQLLAEGVVGFVTCVFAITSYLNLYKSLSPEFVLLLRIIIFTTAAITSLNLYLTIKKLESD